MRGYWNQRDEFGMPRGTFEVDPDRFDTEPVVSKTTPEVAETWREIQKLTACTGCSHPLHLDGECLVRPLYTAERQCRCTYANGKETHQWEADPRD